MKVQFQTLTSRTYLSKQCFSLFGAISDPFNRATSGANSCIALNWAIKNNFSCHSLVSWIDLICWLSVLLLIIWVLLLGFCSTYIPKLTNPNSNKTVAIVLMKIFFLCIHTNLIYYYLTLFKSFLLIKFQSLLLLN